MSDRRPNLRTCSADDLGSAIYSALQIGILDARNARHGHRAPERTKDDLVDYIATEAEPLERGILYEVYLLGRAYTDREKE